MKYFIIAADRIVDGRGNFETTEKILKKSKKLNLNSSTLEIVTLAKRWEDKLKPNEFKSGASAMDAVNRARKILAAHKADVVVIQGQDLLKTGYDKHDRENFMKLYRKKYTPMDGYNKLVPLFLKAHGLTEKEYFSIREELFNNYQRTWKTLHPDSKTPDERWFAPLTKYFRGVDCANPNIDYSARMIVANEKIANLLNIPKKNRIEIAGNAFIKLKVDGFESIPEIASYLHLKKTITKALKDARIDFKHEFLNDRAALDAYTCYPVVPMGLLKRLNLASTAAEMIDLLKTKEITVTGGLNLGKAAWNLTSLNGIIEMREKLMTHKKLKFGLVHGNGSIGNQQGITVLKKC